MAVWEDAPPIRSEAWDDTDRDLLVDLKSQPGRQARQGIYDDRGDAEAAARRFRRVGCEAVTRTIPEDGTVGVWVCWPDSAAATVAGEGTTTEGAT